MPSALRTCPFCLGTRLCHRCGGNGSVQTLRSETRPCRECGGSGKCSLCGDSGSLEAKKSKESRHYPRGEDLRKRVTQGRRKSH